MLCKRCACADKSRCLHPYWYEFTIRGKRYKKTTSTKDKRLAGQLESQERAKVLERRAGLAEPDLVLLKTHVDDYLKYTAQHNSTSYKDTIVLANFLEVVGNQPLPDVTAFQIQKWMIKRANVVSRSTVNRELNIIRGCLSRAVDWKRLVSSPAGQVERFHVDDVRIRVFTDDELRAVLTSGNDFVELLCRVTLESLARLSEVLELRREHFGPTWIEFRRKGGKVTRAAVTAPIRARLLARCHPDGAIFGEGALGHPPSEQTASNRVVRLLKRLHIRDASHHTMRHTGVTMMLERGDNPRAIQQLAGWGSMRMLERYGHARDASIRQAVTGNADHLDNLLASASPADSSVLPTPEHTAESLIAVS
jgi:integrase